MQVAVTAKYTCTLPVWFVNVVLSVLLPLRSLITVTLILSVICLQIRDIVRWILFLCVILISQVSDLACNSCSFCNISRALTMRCIILVFFFPARLCPYPWPCLWTLSLSVRFPSITCSLTSVNLVLSVRFSGYFDPYLCNTLPDPWPLWSRRKVSRRMPSRHWRAAGGKCLHQQRVGPRFHHHLQHGRRQAPQICGCYELLWPNLPDGEDQALHTLS